MTTEVFDILGGNAMDNPIFRKKSVERISSPEQLNDYLHVTNLSVWLLLIAVAILLVGLLIWGGFAYITSFVGGAAVVNDGQMNIAFEDQDKARNISSGMKVTVGGDSTTVLSVGKDESGNYFAVANTSLSDGEYECIVHYDQIQVLKLLFN